MSETGVSTVSDHSSAAPSYYPAQPDSSALPPYHGPQMVAVGGPGPAPYYHHRRPTCPQFPCCCCGLNNKQGTVLTGILSMVISTIRVVLISLIYFTPVDEDLDMKETLTIRIPIEVILTMVIVDFLINLQLAVGVHFYESKIVCITWIVWTGIYLFYAVYASGLNWLPGTALYFALNLYPLWVVIAFVMEPKNPPQDNHV